MNLKRFVAVVALSAAAVGCNAKPTPEATTALKFFQASGEGRFGEAYDLLSDTARGPTTSDAFVSCMVARGNAVGGWKWKVTEQSGNHVTVAATHGGLSGTVIAVVDGNRVSDVLPHDPTRTPCAGQ